MVHPSSRQQVAAAAPPTKLGDGKLALCWLGLPLAIAMTLVSGAGLLAVMGEPAA